MSNKTNDHMDMKPRASNQGVKDALRKDDAVDKGMSDNEEDDDVSSIPLFSLGLPSDFACNATLSAIAALMEDNEKPKKVDVMYSLQPPTGGGKAVKTRTSSYNRSPYSKKDTVKQKTTVKEIELFMKMWKP